MTRDEFKELNDDLLKSIEQPMEAALQVRHSFGILPEDYSKFEINVDDQHYRIILKSHSKLKAIVFVLSGRESRQRSRGRSRSGWRLHQTARCQTNRWTFLRVIFILFLYYIISN